MLPQVLLVVAVGSLLQAIEAADCNLSEERQSDFPSGQDISNALIKQDSLNNICSNEWSPLQNLIKTYNEGFVVYNVTRKTTDAAPEDNGCQTGFQNIVDQCIVSSNYWGGTYTFNDFTYAISNAVYPSNGLPSWDAAPSATESTSTDETLATSSVSTTVYPDSTQSSDDGSSSTITPAPGPIISLGDSSPTSTPGQTIVTETNSAGDQIVATFVPSTFADYTTLTSSITITSTTTDSNGAPLLIPLIVGAGGVAWAIAGVPPPGVVPPGGVPDPEVPDSGDGGSGNDNDNPTPTTSNTDPASSTTSSSSATSSSSTDGPIVTAIADFEYPDIRQLQAIMIDPSGPLPEDDSGSVTITATSPSDTSSTAQPTTTTKSTTTPSTANVLCQDDCTAIIPQLSVYGDLICSSDDFDKFLDHGTTSDPNGNADWFRISSHEDCYLVMAKSAVHRGFPDQYCFRKDAIIDFVNQNALGCKFGDGFLRKSGAQQAQSKTSGNGELCLANFKNYQSCGETSV